MCPYAMWSVKCLTIILTHHGSGRTTKNHTTQTNPQSPPALCSVAVSPNLIIEEDEKLHGNWRFRRCSRRTAIALRQQSRSRRPRFANARLERRHGSDRSVSGRKKIENRRSVDAGVVAVVGANGWLETTNNGLWLGGVERQWT
ncbi:hypothetical protein DEO72_LG10g1514 [Vigna unguiculata]|uniref:Uncharacterized protein n=1 Tax=Vigna unguiculata TaxID=3917 RepID=A0A4D6N974_VIGUN|nr:hypothetical protein DEO72_LG10g1514 [Vigna unguiculata]